MRRAEASAVPREGPPELCVREGDIRRRCSFCVPRTPHPQQSLLSVATRPFEDSPGEVDRPVATRRARSHADRSVTDSCSKPPACARAHSSSVRRSVLTCHPRRKRSTVRSAAGLVAGGVARRHGNVQVTGGAVGGVRAAPFRRRIDRPPTLTGSLSEPAARTAPPWARSPGLP